MASVNLTHVNDNTHQVVGAGSFKISQLTTVSATPTVSVGKHVQLKRKVDRLFDLGRRAVVSSLLILKTLSSLAPYFGFTWAVFLWQQTLSWTDSTLGSRLMLVWRLACCVELQL